MKVGGLKSKELATSLVFYTTSYLQFRLFPQTSLLGNSQSKAAAFAQFQHSFHPIYPQSFLSSQTATENQIFVIF